MVEKKEWSDFQATGLLLFVNHFLHIFGWAIVLQIEDGKIVSVFPARVKYRGFSESATTEAYSRIHKFMEENAVEIKDEHDNEITPQTNV